MENVGKLVVAVFLVVQTADWFWMPIYRIELDRQSAPVTQPQAGISLLAV